MNSTNDVLVDVENLTKYFPHDDSWFVRLHPAMEPKPVRAVDGVSFQIRRGETLGLVGESGCGKSTLARTLCHLLKPTSGSVYFEGENVVDFDDEKLRAFRGDVQMVFQDPFSSLNPRYTIRKTLAEPMKVHGIGGSKRDRTRRAADLLNRVGLDPQYLDRHPHEFSGGQRQRIAIARALAVEPKLIVADEPTSALDVSVQANILELLSDLKEERNLTMLFISHDLSVVRYVSDRMSVMYLGDLVESGETDEIFSDPKHPYTQSLLSSIPSPDPLRRTEFVPLRGDVPNPTDPPSGCRFHPRCPLIIPPSDWPGEQEGWYDLFRFRMAIEDEEIGSEEVRAGGHEEYISEEAVALLPDEAEGRLRDALEYLENGDRERALETISEIYPSACETDVPATIKDQELGDVKCHLYDSNQPGEPSTVDSQRSESSGVTVSDSVESRGEL